MPIGAVVADANVLLSAAIGKSALRVFTDHDLVIHATRFNAEEVERYLPRLARKYDLPDRLVELQWRLLPVRLHGRDAYEAQFERALELLAERDPDDAHPLALAFSLDLPLWSNDRDLQGHGIDCLTTGELLRRLER